MLRQTISFTFEITDSQALHAAAIQSLMRRNVEIMSDQAEELLGTDRQPLLKDCMEELLLPRALPGLKLIVKSDEIWPHR